MSHRMCIRRARHSAHSTVKVSQPVESWLFVYLVLCLYTCHRLSKFRDSFAVLTLIKCEEYRHIKYKDTFPRWQLNTDLNCRRCHYSLPTCFLSYESYTLHYDIDTGDEKNTLTNALALEIAHSFILATVATAHDYSCKPCIHLTICLPRYRHCNAQQCRLSVKWVLFSFLFSPALVQCILVNAIVY